MEPLHVPCQLRFPPPMPSNPLPQGTVVEAGAAYSILKGMDEQRAACPLVRRNVRIVSAAAGARHSVALASDGGLFAWGCGRHGQLGLDHVAAHIQQVPPCPRQPYMRLRPHHWWSAAAIVAALLSGGMTP